MKELSKYYTPTDKPHSNWIVKQKTYVAEAACKDNIHWINSDYQ